jgi:hypothetical protein
MGPPAFTSCPKEDVLRIFITLKNQSPPPGLNLRPLGPVASTLLHHQNNFSIYTTGLEFVLTRSCFLLTAGEAKRAHVPAYSQPNKILVLYFRYKSKLKLFSRNSANCTSLRLLLCLGRGPMIFSVTFLNRVLPISMRFYPHHTWRLLRHYRLH